MKYAVLAALFAISGAASAAEPIAVSMLDSPVTVRISDDGHNTFLDMGEQAATELPIVFELTTMGHKRLRNYTVESDGRLKMPGVLRHGDLILGGERVEINRI